MGWLGFRLRVTTPPAAESGTIYETVDARCGACVVKGGSEAKCVSKQWEEKIGGPLGRECPRVELHPELSPDVELLEFVLSERLRGLLAVRALAVAEVYGMSVEELNDSLSRVAAVIAHPDIAAILNPSVEG